MLACALASCLDEGDPDLTAEDCIPTWGDYCGCTPQCMTAAEIADVNDGEVCDLHCDPPTWECTVVDATCAVVDAR